MKISNQEGLPWGLEPKFRFYLWSSKRIQHLKGLWIEDGNKWEFVRNFKRITQSRNAIEKIKAFIHNVPWNLKCPNPLPKPSLGEWRVLGCPQEHLTIQEFYHV
jgi:hypothetical protein